LRNGNTVFITYEKVGSNISTSIIIANVQGEQATIIFIGLVCGIYKR